MVKKSRRFVTFAFVELRLLERFYINPTFDKPSTFDNVGLFFMKKTELRIGNNIFLGESIVEVVEIRSNGIMVTNSVKGGVYTYSEFSPIYLNEEWLLKLGFVLIKEYTYILLKNNVYGYVDELEFFFEPKEKVCITFRQKEIMSKERDSVFLKDIEYVHQLQNIYFALTGKELVL